MSFFNTFSQMLVILFAIAVGAAANRLGYLDKETNQKISHLLLNITMPAMVMASVSARAEMPELAEILSILWVSVVFYGVELLFVLVVPRLVGGTSAQRGVWSYTLVFPNIAYIGYPVVVRPAS